MFRRAPGLRQKVVEDLYDMLTKSDIDFFIPQYRPMYDHVHVDTFKTKAAFVKAVGNGVIEVQAPAGPKTHEFITKTLRSMLEGHLNADATELRVSTQSTFDRSGEFYKTYDAYMQYTGAKADVHIEIVMFRSDFITDNSEIRYHFLFTKAKFQQPMAPVASLKAVNRNLAGRLNYPNNAAIRAQF